MEKPRITQLKDEFFEWCWMLSLDEIASNRPLMRAIEKIKRKLLQAECAGKQLVPVRAR
jgi:hypothetical protein